jgi:alpha(1,3/1,4) fucosyltransferase
MLKLKFDSFWKGFNYENNFFTNLLKSYDIKYEIVDQNPHILIFSPLRREEYIEKHIIQRWNHVKKIFYTGENNRPRRDVELNLTFDLTKKFNNFRLPLWIIYFYRYNLKTNFTLKNNDASGFCSFVYSRGTSFRKQIYSEFKKYKLLGSGGGLLNNVGGKVKNKIDFQRKYKFCLAIEHTNYPGYTTEKIFEAFLSNSIPIYFGSDIVVEDFNKETFINANDFKSIKEVLEYVKKVDNDNNLYNSYMNKPILTKKWIDNFDSKKYYKKLLDKILEGIDLKKINKN